jgi:TIGR03009 family protein
MGQPGLQGQPGTQNQGGAQGQPSGPNDPGIAFPPRMQDRMGPLAPKAGPTPPPVPFILSPEEQRQLDQALAAWEQRNKEIKRFECRYTVWDYDSTFGVAIPGKGEEPVCVDQGELKYLAPDKGLYHREGKRPEHWLCDGRSMYQYDYARKKVVESPLPPEVQGKSISDGPLPFVFGTESNRLKQRYFLRIITPRDRPDEVWLEARPRFQRDALDFQKAELILKTNGLLPFAIQLYHPGGKQRTVYQFEKVVVNRKPVFIEPDWTRPNVPFGWKKELDPQAAAAAQAARGQGGGRR